MSSEKEIIIEATEKANKRELSLDEAQDLVERFPESHRANVVLAFLYFQNEKFIETVKQINKSQKFGKSVTAFNLSAQAKINLGRFGEAEKDYLNSFDLDENDYMTLINYSAFLSKRGNFTEAIKLIKKSILLKPNDLSLKVKLVNVYHQSLDFESAIEFLKNVTKEFPDEYLFFHLLGNSYFKYEKKDAAVSSYKKAIEINPNSANSYFNLSTYYYDLKEFSEAILMLEKSIEIRPEWEAPYIQLCFNYYQQNKFSKFKNFVIKNKKYLQKSIEVAALSELVAAQEEEKSIHNFCPEPMKYITEFDIKDYIPDHNNFLKKIIKEIDTYDFFDGYAPLSGKSQINGKQTIGNIFSKDDSKIFIELKNFFTAAVNDFYKKYQSSDNLLFKDFPKEINLWAWSTKFDKGSGHHFSHIHPRGWVSGSFYLKMPNDIKKNEANIQFDLKGNLPVFNKKIKIDEKKILPEEGKLIIFPSSLYHCTTPFDSKKSYRHAINFDMLGPDKILK